MAAHDERIDSLTPREREVLALVRRGLTNEEIAQRLGISLDGAKYHVSQILSKLSVASREEAAAFAEPADRGSPWRRLAGAAVVAAALAGISVLAWSVLANEGDGTEATPPHISLQTVYSRVLEAIAEPGIVFEASSQRAVYTDRDIVTAPTSHWFYSAGNAARTLIVGADEQGRSPIDHLAVGSTGYRGAASRWREEPAYRPCPGSDDMMLSFLLHCYDLWAPQDDSRCIVVRDIQESDFRDTRTIAIGVGTATGSRCAESDAVYPQNSSHEGTLHIDPETYLPLSWHQAAGSPDFDVFYEYTKTAIDEIPEGFFDPTRNTGIRLPVD